MPAGDFACLTSRRIFGDAIACRPVPQWDALLRFDQRAALCVVTVSVHVLAFAEDVQAPPQDGEEGIGIAYGADVRQATRRDQSMSQGDSFQRSARKDLSYFVKFTARDTTFCHRLFQVHPRRCPISRRSSPCVGCG